MATQVQDPKLKKPTEADPNPAGDQPIEQDAPASKFFDSVISATAPVKEKEEKPKPDKPKEDKPKAAAQRSKPAKAAPAAPVIDEEKLGTAISKGIAEHLKPKEEKIEKSDDLDDEDKKRVAVLERMEKLQPEKYKGLADRFKGNTKKLREYAAKWETEHPGQEFDEESDDHKDFIAGLEGEVDYQDDDYTDALADIRADSRLVEHEKKLNDRLSAIELQDKAAKEAPVAGQAALQRGDEFWQALGEDYADVIKDGKVDPEALKTRAEADPVAAQITESHAAMVERETYVVHMLSRGLPVPARNEEEANANNAIGQDMGRFAVWRENAMLAKPEAERVSDDGRKFVAKKDYDRMTKAEREKHWTYSPEEILYMRLRWRAKLAKQQLAEEDKKFTSRAKAKGLLKGEEDRPRPATKKPTKTEEVEEEEDDLAAGERGRKPDSPSAPSSPKVAPKGGKPGDDGKNNADRFVASVIG